MPVRRAFRTVWSGMSGGVGYELVAVSYQSGTYPKTAGLTLDGMHQGPEFPSFTATIDVAIQVNGNAGVIVASMPRPTQTFRRCPSRRSGRHHLDNPKHPGNSRPRLLRSRRLACRADSRPRAHGDNNESQTCMVRHMCASEYLGIKPAKRRLAKRRGGPRSINRFLPLALIFGCTA